MTGDDETPPLPLTAAEASQITRLNWSFALGPLGGMHCLSEPRLGQPDLMLQAYEVISKEPLLANHGLVLLAQASPDCDRSDHGPSIPRHLMPPRGYVIAGIAAARRATTGPHPFAAHFPKAYRQQRQALIARIRQNLPVPPDAPRLMLRCILREMASHSPQLILPLAREYDRPLWQALGGETLAEGRAD